MTQHNIVGNYRNNIDPEFSAHLILNKDSTYVFSQQSGLVFFKGVGKWNISNDTIFLKNEYEGIETGTPIGDQKLFIDRLYLIEIVDGHPSGLKLKRE